MRKVLAATVMGLLLAGTASAQVDVGRLLDQVVPGRGPDPRAQQDRDRSIYEQGRRDEEVRREQARRREAERGPDRGFDGRRGDIRRDDDRRGEFRRDDDRGRGYDDRRRVDEDRGAVRRY